MDVAILARLKWARSPLVGDAVAKDVFVCPLLAVTSTGRRNTGLKSFCRRLVAERHARALVELPCDVV